MASKPNRLKSKAKQPAAPRHLSAAARRWWSDVAEEYELESHHLKLLSMCAEAWDRCCQARQVLDKEGVTYEDRFGQPKARPEVAIERDSRVAFARLLRELTLDADPPAEVRPPRLHGTGG
jgi:P27 family predicted phage terminase small subunit